MTGSEHAPQDFPPTIVVVHPRERRSKCSVNHLRGRAGFLFRKYPARDGEPLDAYVRLGFGGPIVGPDDADCGLLVLDGTWRWAERMERDYAEVPVRSLPAVATAYPRVSATYEDPAGGLATIEAIYAAYRLLGRETDGLLDEYHWMAEFLERNRELFETGN